MIDAPTPPPVRTGPALLKPVAWRPEPLDVVLVLGFLLLVGGIGLRFGVAEALIVAGVLLLVAWARIVYSVGLARRADEVKSDGVDR